MTQSYLNARFEQIEKRFREVSILLEHANLHRDNEDLYKSLCRSAHVLLVSHFEGLYKDVVRDVIDDINHNTFFSEVKKDIQNTHCNYFLTGNENDKQANGVRNKLKEAFKSYQSAIKSESFLFVDNKNPAPVIIETILSNFGISRFFQSLESSDLDIVFQNQKSTIIKLKNRLLSYLKKSTYSYPYLSSISVYKPASLLDVPKKKNTLWEEFLNDFLRERHDIIHGHTLTNPNDNQSLEIALLKIEILVYVYIINIAAVANPVYLLN